MKHQEFLHRGHHIPAPQYGLDDGFDTGLKHIDPPNHPQITLIAPIHHKPHIRTLQRQLILVWSARHRNNLSHIPQPNHQSILLFWRAIIQTDQIGEYFLETLFIGDGVDAGLHAHFVGQDAVVWAIAERDAAGFAD